MKSKNEDGMVSVESQMDYSEKGRGVTTHILIEVEFPLPKGLVFDHEREGRIAHSMAWSTLRDHIRENFKSEPLDTEAPLPVMSIGDWIRLVAEWGDFEKED